ncbi:MAG: hypothetical protein ACR2FN_04890 [Chitinophagaceae bacterium]
MKLLIIVSHFVSAIIITVIMGLIYISVQQNYRTSVNDPQIQIARDISNRLQQNRSIQNLLPADSIDLSQSLGLFIELFNAQGEPIQSTGLLNEKMPQPPAGVLAYTKTHGEDWITWQPQTDVRIATIVKSVNSKTVAYVLAGRSLNEVEVRENNLMWIVFICWIVCLSFILIHFIVQSYFNNRIVKRSIAN